MLIYYDKNARFSPQVEDLSNNENSHFLTSQIETLSNSVNSNLDLWNTKLKILVECLMQLNSAIQITVDIESPQQLADLLKELQTNLNDTRSIIEDLKSMKKILDLTSSCENIPESLENYNTIATKCNNKIENNTEMNIETFILNFIKNMSLLLSPSAQNNDSNAINTEPEVQSKETKSKLESQEHQPELKSQEPLTEIKNSEPQVENTMDITDNNVLLISEIQNKVVLPYSVADLHLKLENNKDYNCLQDVIDNEYCFPMSKYKNPAIARFKEAYNLMRVKENYSITDSLDLALELTFKSLLNPAIISACKNLDELDIYLDYLDSNELDKFPLFEIKYEILPKKID